MAGHLEEAAGALNAAADHVPLETTASAEDALTIVTQHLQQVGGPLGEQLIQETSVVQDQVRQCMAVLAALREKLRQAATQVLSGAV